MRRNTLAMAVLSLACCCSLHTFAQYDSSRLDAGYLHLKKEFTQTISIKGTDLEKMPFADLSDAIGAWLYGAYTQPATLLYVVDGNPVSDVNAYSVHDIEEVVLVQNAAALVGTANGQQELVLIRTKRGKGPGGVTVAAQSGLVKGTNTDTRWYHDYYAGAYRNLGKISFGVSGNYLRDAMPEPSTVKTSTPDNLQRWRLNGYFTWRPNQRNQVELTMNYTPQQSKSVGDSVTQAESDQYNNSAHQHFVLPHLLWHSDLLPGLKNDLQATYLHSTGKANDQFLSLSIPDSNYATLEGLAIQQKSYHLWIRDHLAFRMTAGQWSIEPAVNASYEHINEEQDVAEVEYQYIGQSGGGSLNPGGGTLTYNSAYSYYSKTNLYLLTPAIDISYRRALDVQGGVLMYVGHQEGSGARRNFPFASLSLDLLRLADDKNSSSLKIFGSYAQRTVLSTQGYGLSDLTPTSVSGSGINPGGSLGGVYGFSSGGQQGQVYVAPSGTPRYWVWEAGVSYSGWKGRLMIQYNFERRNFLSFAVVPLPGGSQAVVYPEWHSSLHSVDVRVKVLDRERLRWQTGVSLTLLRNQSNSPYATGYNLLGKTTIGDNAPGPNSWTGGWVNRVQVKDFTAGVDLLYHFGESVGHITNSGSMDTSRLSSVMVPNIYIGYRWHLPHAQTLEFFLESRGLVRKSSSDLLDKRRYYTVGGKLSI
jgi:hypothetical protein